MTFVMKSTLSVSLVGGAVVMNVVIQRTIRQHASYDMGKFGELAAT